MTAILSVEHRRHKRPHPSFFLLVNFIQQERELFSFAPFGVTRRAGTAVAKGSYSFWLARQIAGSSIAPRTPGFSGSSDYGFREVIGEARTSEAQPAPANTMSNAPKPNTQKQSKGTMNYYRPQPLLLRGVRGRLASALAIGLSLASFSGRLQAADAPPPSRVDALVNFEFADKYLTPRGMIVHDDGLAFQMLVLGLVNLYKADTFINDITLVPGVWNDFSTKGVSIHPPFGSKPKTSWVEIDPIAGVSVGFAKRLKLDVTYTAFNMQILDIGTSQHLETKLSLDDSPWLKGFALHPYFSYWQELHGKATAAQVPFKVFLNEPGKPPSSYYFEVGGSPSYTFEKLAGLKLEAPCRVLLPNKDFYGEFFHKSSTIGLYEVGIKGSIPLNFMPQGYGHWGFHAGFRYMGFEDKNLQGMQIFNAPGKATKDAVQIYCGISTFF